MKIFLTGNQGYIGSVMEEVLLKEGYDVITVDTGFFLGKDFIPHDEIVQKNRKNQIIKDIRSLTTEDLKGGDVVIHLAALSNDPLGNLDPNITHDINYQATARLGELAKAAGVKRFIYSSSCSLYGAADTTQALTEEAPFNPQTPYAQSKVDSEAALSKLSSETFAPIFMRNATVYGLSPRMRFDLVVNNLCGWAFTTNEVVMMSDGKPWRPIVHVRDLCNAFVAAIETPLEQVNNQAFNVGINSENFRVKEIAEAVVQGIPESTLKCLNQNPNDTRSYRVNFDKIQTLKKFQPLWDLRKGIKELHKSFQALPLTKELFEHEYFTTLKRMQGLLARQEINKELRWSKND